MTKSVPIGVFLHVATIGRYNEVSDEVLAALRGSALFQQISYIEVNVLGVGDFTTPFDDPRLTVIRRSSDITDYEHPTLTSLQRFCSGAPNGKVLYLNCL